MRIWFKRVCVWFEPLPVEDLVVLRVGDFLGATLRVVVFFADALRVVDLRVDFVTISPCCVTLVFDQRAQIGDHLRRL